jgi:hypothetical protein
LPDEQITRTGVPNARVTMNASFTVGVGLVLLITGLVMV